MIQLSSSVANRGSISLGMTSILRKTYLLLSCTLLFSAICAYYSMQLNYQPNIIIMLIGIYGLSFLTMALRRSKWGLVAVFLFTGFMGFSIGPMLNLYLKGFSNGPQLVSSAAGLTGILFFSLSLYTIVQRKNYSYLGGFLFAASLVAVIGAFALFFLQMPMLQVVISGAFAVISCGWILYTTSQIIHGGEDSYIQATVMLFISVFNLFVSILQLLAIFGGGSRK